MIPVIGEWVSWKWLNGVAEGEVTEIHFDKVQIVSKGKLITRKGSKENPAIAIKHKSGNDVLKLSSELLS